MVQIISFFVIFLSKMDFHIFVIIVIITMHNSICLYSIKKISAYIHTLNSRIKVSYYYLSIKDEEKKKAVSYEKTTNLSK